MTEGRRGTTTDTVSPLTLALWFGLLGGLGESALFATQRFVLDRDTRSSFQNLWTAPIGEACLLLVPGLVIWLVLRFRPQVSWFQAAVSLFAFVAVFGPLTYSYQIADIARWILAAGIAAQAGRLAAPRRAAVTRLVRVTLPVLVAAVVVIALALNVPRWRAERRAIAALPAAPPDAPNVLLLILDTVRSLNLSAYGYARPTTPALERLAARGVAFDRAIAPSSWTLPSHATLFTGRLPHELSVAWDRPLDRAHPTLAESFRDAGYLTAGFVGNLVYVTDESGLDRGFTHFESVRVTPGSIAFSARFLRMLLEWPVGQRVTGQQDLLWRRTAPQLRARALKWLDARPERPWFAFLNLYDAHNPYLPPPPFDTLFSGRRVPWRERNPWLHQEAPVDTAGARIERDAYDNALAWVDHEIGGLLDDLEQRGALRNTIVVVTSDHGEEFGEHGLLGHGNSLYYQSLHVPLIIAWPGHVPAARRVSGTVSLRDLPATILDLAGRSAALPGTSLRRAWEANATADTAIAEVQQAVRVPDWFPAARGDMASSLTDSRQYIQTRGGDSVAFDLGRDPTGSTAATDTAGMGRLRALLPLRR